MQKSLTFPIFFTYQSIFTTIHFLAICFPCLLLLQLNFYFRLIAQQSIHTFIFLSTIKNILFMISTIIAGICIGGIVFIVILITIIYLYLHHSKMKANLITQSEYTKLTKSNKKFQINSQKIIQFNLVNCAICFDGDCDLITPCQHQFHVYCFKQWTNKNGYCPICQNKNIQIVKIAMCKKCQRYEHFEISKTLNSKLKQKQNGESYVKHIKQQNIIDYG